MGSTPVLVLLFVILMANHSLAEKVICEKLPQDLCAFAVSSTSRRCVLESSPVTAAHVCRTSDVVVDHHLFNWIETDECVDACGVDRSSVGISSDSLHDEGFTRKLCSTHCYQNCPNIIDLYFHLAAGEGFYLSNLCNAREGVRRSMVDTLSSGAAASSPSPAP